MGGGALDVDLGWSCSSPTLLLRMSRFSHSGTSIHWNMKLYWTSQACPGALHLIMLPLSLSSHSVLYSISFFGCSARGYSNSSFVNMERFCQYCIKYFLILSINMLMLLILLACFWNELIKQMFHSYFDRLHCLWSLLLLKIILSTLGLADFVETKNI